MRAFGGGLSVAGGRGGVMYAAWFEDVRGRRSRILLARSTDAGATWSRPEAVADEPTQVFLPTVAVAPDGTVGVLWYDFRRFSGRSGELAADIWLATSRNGSSPWHAAHVAGSFDMRTAADSGGYFVGDYVGLQAAASGFAALYVAARPLATVGPSDVFFWSSAG